MAISCCREVAPTTVASHVPPPEHAQAHEACALQKPTLPTPQVFADLQEREALLQVLVKFSTHLEQTNDPCAVLQRLCHDLVGACPPIRLAWIWLGEQDVPASSPRSWPAQRGPMRRRCGFIAASRRSRNPFFRPCCTRRRTGSRRLPTRSLRRRPGMRRLPDSGFGRPWRCPCICGNPANMAWWCAQPSRHGTVPDRCVCPHATHRISALAAPIASARAARTPCSHRPPDKSAQPSRHGTVPDRCVCPHATHRISALALAACYCAAVPGAASASRPRRSPSRRKRRASHRHARRSSSWRTPPISASPSRP